MQSTCVFSVASLDADMLETQPVISASEWSRELITSIRAKKEQPQLGNLSRDLKTAEANTRLLYPTAYRVQHIYLVMNTVN